MDSEWTYRTAVGGLLALYLPLGAYHRWKAKTGEPLHRRDEGLFVLVGLRLSGLLAMLAIVFYLLDPRRLSWAQAPVPDQVRWTGLPIGLAAAAWLLWTFRWLGANLTDTVTVRARANLVTNGPYRWVRHPFYIGVVLVIVSISLLTASALLAALGSLTIMLIILRTRTEEAKLEARFGTAYREYRSRTGFLFPRIRSAR